MPAPAIQLSAELAQAGWDVDIEEGGLVVSARPDRIDSLRASGGLYEVATVVGAAVKLAIAAGARPVGALP